MVMHSAQSNARMDLKLAGAPAIMTRLFSSKMPVTSHFGAGMLRRSEMARNLLAGIDKAVLHYDGLGMNTSRWPQ